MKTEITDMDRELYKMALKVSENAYAPFSGFKVGACLLTTEGNTFTGVNVENSSYGATICAERTAIAKAVSEGFCDFQTIAITGSGGEAWPCGICRQVMFEFSPKMRVVTGKDVNSLRAFTAEELLPEGFRLEENR